MKESGVFISLLLFHSSSPAMVRPEVSLPMCAGGFVCGAGGVE